MFALNSFAIMWSIDRVVRLVHSYAGPAGPFLRGPDTEYIYTLAAVTECNMGRRE